jgi:polysaccharide pyruvyl transferase WcaK-like protein
VDNYTTAGPDVFDSMDRYARDFAGRTDRAYRRTNNRIDPPSEAELARLLRLYAESDVVLSSALHGCIIAVAMHKKVLAVSGDHKIEAFMQAAGLGEWVCELDDTDSIPERLRRLSSQVVPNGFVEAGRRANEAIATDVLRLARARPNDVSVPDKDDVAYCGATRP